MPISTAVPLNSGDWWHSFKINQLMAATPGAFKGIKYPGRSHLDYHLPADALPCQRQQQTGGYCAQMQHWIPAFVGQQIGIQIIALNIAQESPLYRSALIICG